MKYKDNSGVDSSTLKKGYSSTGNIPEAGESVNSSSDESSEKSMLKMYGFPEEVETGGFLERNNFSDRY